MVKQIFFCALDLIILPVWHGGVDGIAINKLRNRLNRLCHVYTLSHKSQSDIYTTAPSVRYHVQPQETPSGTLPPDTPGFPLRHSRDVINHSSRRQNETAWLNREGRHRLCSNVHILKWLRLSWVDPSVDENFKLIACTGSLPRANWDSEMRRKLGRLRRQRSCYQDGLSESVMVDNTAVRCR